MGVTFVYFHSNGSVACSTDLLKIMARRAAACSASMMRSSFRNPSGSGAMPGFRPCISFTTPCVSVFGCL